MRNEILPAIIPQDFEDLASKVGQVVDGAEWIHLDVEDGTLTVDKAWPYNNTDQRFELISHGSEELPCTDIVKYEAHLMVSEPERIMDDWRKAGIDRFIVHAEIETTSLYACIDLAHEFNLELGLAVNLDTPLDEKYKHIGEVDFLHLMSIPSIGTQGKPFDKRIFGRIKEVRKLFPEKVISVDGGVNLDNARNLLDAGVNRLSVGSAIFAKDVEDKKVPLETLFKLQKL